MGIANLNQYAIEASNRYYASVDQPYAHRHGGVAFPLFARRFVRTAIGWTSDVVGRLADGQNSDLGRLRLTGCIACRTIVTDR